MGRTGDGVVVRPRLQADAAVGEQLVQEEDLPLRMEECRNGGWMRFGIFRNQGDCVSFVVTDGRNAPAGYDTMIPSKSAGERNNATLS